MAQSDNDKTPQVLALEHWAWLESYLKTILGRTYIDAFIHGYKHGVDHCNVEQAKFFERERCEPTK